MQTILQILSSRFRLLSAKQRNVIRQKTSTNSGFRCILLPSANSFKATTVTTAHFKLDRIDHKIIEILKTDGRISYQKLAELIHLTPRPCQERVRKLERAGIIRGYTALIEEEREFTSGIVLQLHIALASQSGRAAQVAFEAEIKQRADVLSCWLVSGPFDYMLRLRCHDMDTYRAISNEWLANTAFKIEKIISSPEMQTIK